MKLIDYSPPPFPSPDQQRDALRKGLGRAMQWATTERLRGECLLEACLHDLRFDMQVEDCRGGWLWHLIQAAGAAERCGVPILHALHGLHQEDDAEQLCELALHFAKAGDTAFKTQLYEIVEQKPFEDHRWLGEEQIIALDGEAAFLFAARLRGKCLRNGQWDWDDSQLVDHAAERLGEHHVHNVLRHSSDQAIQHFYEAWLQDEKAKADRKPYPSHKTRMEAISLDEIVSTAASAGGYPFRGWGMHASEADLDAVLQFLWTAKEPKVIANLLRVFSNRALPQFDHRLIDLCQRHNEPEVQRWAFNALEKNAHPLVREFAVNELRKGVGNRFIVGLFIKNYLPGDERELLEHVELPPDDCEQHWLLSDVIDVLEGNPGADCSKLGVVAYGSTPCECCRLHASRLLHGQNVAPQWLRDECRFDSDPDAHNLAGETRIASGS